MKENLLGEIRDTLFGKIPNDEIPIVIDSITFCMRNYELTEKVTSVVVYDQSDSQIIGKFFVAKSVEGLCKSSLDYYRTILKCFFTNVGKHVKEIETNDIRVYLAYKKMSKCSDNTLNNIRRVLSSFFVWCTEEEICRKNPMLRIKGIRLTKKIRKPLTEDEMELLRYGAKTKRDKAIIEFLYSTGCRVSEMLGVNRGDIDLASGELEVLGKGRKYRTVYLSSRCKSVLREYLEERNDDCEPLFISTWEGFGGTRNHNLRRMSRSAVEVMVRNLGKRVNIENVHPHRFRRTAASIALKRGMPIEQVQKMLGHESIETTTIYAQSSCDEVKRNHELFLR